MVHPGCMRAAFGGVQESLTHEVRVQGYLAREKPPPPLQEYLAHKKPPPPRALQ